MSSLNVSLLGSSEEREWDSFVHSTPQATFFHLCGWKHVIERAFGHRTYYLCARRGKDIVGLLPLTHVKSLLFGNALISNAFCVHGGIVAGDDEVRTALEAEALKIAIAEKVDYVEFRASGTLIRGGRRNEIFMSRFAAQSTLTWTRI